MGIGDETSGSAWNGVGFFSGRGDFEVRIERIMSNQGLIAVFYYHE